MYMDDIHESRRRRHNQAIAEAARKLDAMLDGSGVGFGVIAGVPVSWLDVFAAAGELHAVIKAADGL